MTRFCLDTSAYSHFKRGSAEAIKAMDSASAIIVSVVVLGELRAGFSHGTRGRENEAELRAFLGHPVVSVVDIDEDTSRHYAEIVVALKKKGTPVPTNDIWIAAIAAREGVPVLTYDGHFRHIDRVGVLVLK